MDDCRCSDCSLAANANVMHDGDLDDDVSVFVIVALCKEGR